MTSESSESTGACHAIGPQDGDGRTGCDPEHAALTAGTADAKHPDVLRLGLEVGRLGALAPRAHLREPATGLRPTGYPAGRPYGKRRESDRVGALAVRNSFRARQVKPTVCRHELRRS